MLKEFQYIPNGVCSKKMEFKIEDNIIKDFKVLGGCSGNLQGITKLITNRDIGEVINLLQGIKCGYKNTSCPDQIAEALIKFKQKEVSK